MNHQILYGRELTVVFAEENRKKPIEMRKKERLRGRGFSEDNGGSYYSHRGHSRTRSRSRTPLRGRHYSRSPSYEERTHDTSLPESPARPPSVERHPHRSRRHERGQSGSESRRYGVERSESRSPASPAGRRPQKGNKHEAYSDAQRADHEHSQSSPSVESKSPPQHSVKGRQKSASPHSGGSSPERYSRSQSRSPPPQRDRLSRYSMSQSPSPPDNHSHDGSEGGGASPVHSSMDD